MQTTGQAQFRAEMEKKLASRPDLMEKIIPSFAPGCRRLTPGKGFLEALLQDNVEVIHSDRIASVSSEKGVELESGRSISDLDVLVCATGFKVAQAPPFPILGRNGVELAKRWSHLSESYLSLAVDGFPNYLMLFGPNSAIGFGSLTKMLEAECDYIVKVIRKLQKEDYASIEPKPERVRDFAAYVKAYFKNTVYMDKCRSWYRKGDDVTGLWPGSTLHALEALRSPRWEDFVYEDVVVVDDDDNDDDDDGNSGANALRWLGNGWSTTQTGQVPSWYIYPEDVDFPHEGRPEENPRYNERPWSY